MYSLPFKMNECPQKCLKDCGKDVTACPVYAGLSPVLQEKCRSNLHLLKYLAGLPIDKLGMPEYYPNLNRSLKGIKNPNLIYPANDEIFIHILSNMEDIRNHYIPIEPCLYEPMGDILKQIEESLAEFVGDMDDENDPAKRLATIMAVVDKLVTVKGGVPVPVAREPVLAGSSESDVKKIKKSGGLHLFHSGISVKNKIVLTPFQYQSVRYLIKRNLGGLGSLDPMIQDPNIEDISCSGLGPVFLEHKTFGGLRSALNFETNNELDEFVVEMAEMIKHPVTFRDPCVDATLPDGSRINIVYGTDVSKRGSNFTIRKFTETPLSILELIQFGSLDYDMAAYLSLILQDGMNLWVSGETASGKTTLMNALCTFITPESKIVSIEDTPEVQVPHPNWIRGVTRGSSKNSETSEVSMFDLLKAALRQRPNLIIVGEIRGEEGAIAFQAMQSGHTCMSTFHAASVPKLIQRLTGNPINIPKSYVDNLNVVVICQMVRLPNGMPGRRVTSINEIVGYDSVADAFSFIEAFGWQPLTDTFHFRGYMNSYLLEQKIAPHRGIPYEKRQQIYSQIKQRAEVLKRIAEAKQTGFYELHAMLTKAYREGYFK